MKVVIDFCILLVASVSIGLRHLHLGVFLFLLGLLFLSQVRKTMLLLGEAKTTKVGWRLIQPILLAFVVNGLLGVGIVMSSAPSEQESKISIHQLWSNDLFPVYLGISLLAALALASLLSERNKR